MRQPKIVKRICTLLQKEIGEIEKCKIKNETALCISKIDEEAMCEFQFAVFFVL